MRDEHFSSPLSPSLSPLSPLLKASEELKCKNLLVITEEKEGKEKIKEKTIEFMPLWKWLLNYQLG